MKFNKLQRIFSTKIETKTYCPICGKRGFIKYYNIIFYRDLIDIKYLTKDMRLLKRLAKRNNKKINFNNFCHNHVSYVDVHENKLQFNCKCSFNFKLGEVSVRDLFKAKTNKISFFIINYKIGDYEIDYDQEDKEICIFKNYKLVGKFDMTGLPFPKTKYEIDSFLLFS